MVSWKLWVRRLSGTRSMDWLYTFQCIYFVLSNSLLLTRKMSMYRNEMTVSAQLCVLSRSVKTKRDTYDIVLRLCHLQSQFHRPNTPLGNSSRRWIAFGGMFNHDYHLHRHRLLHDVPYHDQISSATIPLLQVYNFFLVLPVWSIFGHGLSFHINFLFHILLSLGIDFGIEFICTYMTSPTFFQQ